MRELRGSSERKNWASEEYEPTELQGLANKTFGMLLGHRSLNERPLIKFHPLAFLLKMQIPRKSLSGLDGVLLSFP